MANGAIPSDDLLALVRAALAEADRRGNLPIAARLAECLHALGCDARR